MFPQPVRRLGTAWVILNVPLATVVAGAVDSQRSYVFVFVVLASGLFTTPALLASWLALRQVPEGDRTCYELWFGGLVVAYVMGLSMLAGLAFGWSGGDAVGRPMVAVDAALFILGTVKLVRTRSGRRAVSVDVIEAVMAVVVVVAPAGLVWGERVRTSETAWFTIPAALAAVATLFGVYWLVVLVMRLGPGVGMLELCGTTLVILGAVDAAAHVAHGLSDFSLPAPPLIAVHATCMSMLLLVPLHTRRTMTVGLDRLPPQAQVRGAGLVSLLTLAGLPVLLVATAAVDHRYPWAPVYSLGVVTLLLVLAAVRQLVAVRETRGLYARVEKTSEDRRALLAAVMQRADQDRHRVAAQLHEQAVAAYASFVSVIQACTAPGALLPAGGAGTLAGVSTRIRDDLASQADSLRHLMLAIQPLEKGGNPAQSLAAPVRAYVDSLYGDGRAPQVRVAARDGLVLDWMTETIALRIVQEAVRNVWRHSRADNLEVSLGLEDGAVAVRVVDDGIGFDPEATVFESGVAAMRSYAQVIDGDVVIQSAPGAGTTVVGRLGPAAAVRGPEGDEGGTDDLRPRLRLVRGRGPGE